MPTASATKTTTRRKGAAKPARVTPRPFVFTYRCPPTLIARLNEARFILRMSSRTALVSEAIEEYLDRKGIGEVGDRARRSV